MEFTGDIAEPVEIYNQTNFAFTNYTKQKKLQLLVKWAGGKDKKLSTP